MDLQKENDKYLLSLVTNCGATKDEINDLNFDDETGFFESNRLADWFINQINFGWRVWQAAKAQAVQEQDQQVWATSNLTWKDIAFRALSCKVLKSTENWVHVKNIACVGSTTASLICKKLGVDPDGTKFELIEAQEQAND